PPRSTLFPYTTLFRSADSDVVSALPKQQRYSALRYFFGGRRMAEVGGGGGATLGSVEMGPPSAPSPSGWPTPKDSRARNSKSFRSEEHTSELQSQSNL